MGFNSIFNNMRNFARSRGIIDINSPFSKYFPVWNYRMAMFASVPVAIAISMIVYGRQVLVRETTNALIEDHHKESVSRYI
jgi:hypothetical protein